MLHEHSYTETHSVSVTVGNPSPYPWKQFFLVLAEDLWRQLVACCPVVDIRQEKRYGIDTSFEILDAGNDESMKLVLIEIGMGKIIQKFLHIIPFRYPFCKLTQIGRTYPDNRFRFDCRQYSALEISVSCILEALKLPSYFIDDILHDKMIVEDKSGIYQFDNKKPPGFESDSIQPGRSVDQ